MEQTADEIIEVVREGSEGLGGKRGDTAGLIMYGAYIRAFRLFRLIPVS
jgi:hypothetical protein